MEIIEDTYLPPTLRDKRTIAQFIGAVKTRILERDGNSFRQVGAEITKI